MKAHAWDMYATHIPVGRIPGRMARAGFGPAAGTTESEKTLVTDTDNIRKCQSCGARLARDNAAAFCGPCAVSKSHLAVRSTELRADFWEEPILQRALASRHMGQVIRAYRQHHNHGSRGLSQDDIAEWAGITQGQLSRIETGQAVQDLDRLIFWAKLLDVPQRCLWFKLPWNELSIGDQPRAGDPELLPQRPRVGHFARIGPGANDEPNEDPLAAERAAALGADLWELHDVLQPRRVSQSSLALAEEACIRLDARYAELSPLVLLPELRHQLKHVLGWMQESQPVSFRQRLCSLAGRLAGLRAWLYFDIAEYQAADVWFSGAVSAAREADDKNLCGWLLGAQSLIPVEQQDYATAAAFIQEAQALSGRGGSSTTRAWLDVLEARALAGLGDRRGVAAAHQRAIKRLPRTDLAERHHGMDFAGDRLDLSYYNGLSNLLVGEPEAAGAAFGTALDNLPESRIKARAILMLSVALAAAQAQQLDEAVARAGEALTLADDQPIRRVWQRADEVRQALGPADRSAAVREFDERLVAFAGSLERASSS